MNNKRETHLNNMANHLLNNNLTFFIGAGFSRLFKFPSWGELLSEIIEEYDLVETLVETQLFPFITEKDYNEHEKVNELILEKLLGVDYLKLAGYINHILKEKEGITIHEAIKDKILECEHKRLNNADTDSIKGFFQKYKEYLDDIITTNYDTNIEHCFENEVSTIHRDLSSLNNISFKNKVFKIHGCINDDGSEEEDTIIITEKDYNNFITKNRYLFYKVYSFFTEKKIVFIGYSINDPNIRSVLNDVIEENDNKVSLEIYWITWDKMRELDKKYYEEQFNLKIIEECQIIEFFDELQTRIDKNVELRAVREADTEDYVKKYRKNYDDIAYIKDIKESKKEEVVLKYLYDDVVSEKNNIYLRSYLYLLGSVKKNIMRKHKTQVQTVIELDKSLNYNTIRLAYRNPKILMLIQKLELVDILIENLLRFADGYHAFGGYATSIGRLLMAYKMFPDELKINQEFLRILKYLINSSTNGSRNDYGSDWRGLGKVAEYIYLLSEEDTKTLLDGLSDTHIDELQAVRIETVIDNSSIDEEEHYELKYKYIYKKQLNRFFKSNLKRELRKHFKDVERPKDNTYVIQGVEVLLKIYEHEETDYYVVHDIDDRVDLFEIKHGMDKEEFYVCFDGECHSYLNYEELYDDKEKYKKATIGKLNEYFKEE